MLKNFMSNFVGTYMTSLIMPTMPSESHLRKSHFYLIAFRDPNTAFAKVNISEEQKKVLLETIRRKI